MYHALASLFRLTGEDDSRETLLRLLPKTGDEDYMTDRVDIIDHVRAWLESGNGKSLSSELQALLSSGRFEKAIPRLPASEAFFAEDPDELRDEIRALWQSCSFEPPSLQPLCDGPGYIGQELALIGYCLENCTEREELVGVAERFVREHLMQWAPLFAAALAGASTHPAVQYVAHVLQCFLGRERDLLDGAEAIAS